MENQLPIRNEEQRLNGIGGWLILVVISLIVSLITAFLYIKDEMLPLLDTYTLDILANQEPLIKPLVYYELILNGLIVFITISLLILMFKRSRLFPKAMIIYLISIFIFNIIDVVLAINIFGNLGAGNEFFNEVYMGLFRQIIYTTVWVPYFFISKRVKITFLNEKLDSDVNPNGDAPTIVE